MTNETEKNYFEKLNAINVSDKIEKKNNLSYLSWAWAWAELKKLYPNAKKNVVKNEKGWLYHTDGRTCWVEVSVTVNDIEETEYLPVMDYRNQPIAADKVTSMNVNTTLQRAITKAIARHGLGLYVYAGEDLPEEDKPLKKLADGCEEEMRETFAKKNQEDFAGLKAIIESCGGVEELADVLKDKENKAIYNRLKKYEPDLLKLIDVAIATMKEQF